MSRETASKVLKIEAEAILRLISRLDESFDYAVDLLAGCQGRVVTTGMGKSGIVCRKITATLASSGTPSLFLHPAEAVHGDLGMMASGDVVLAISNSGETVELIKLLDTVKRLEISLISMVGNPDSVLAKNSDVVLDVGVDQEACPMGLIPTTSTTVALALGDALAMALSEKKGFCVEDFARLHPGGKLGKKLMRVGELMHSGSQLPKVNVNTSMEKVIYEMSSKGLGVTSIVEQEDRLVGVISDGDLRRLLENKRGEILEQTAGQCMTSNPITIKESALVGSALNLMEQQSITSLMVIDDLEKIVGVLHLHDLWGTEMF